MNIGGDQNFFHVGFSFTVSGQVLGIPAGKHPQGRRPGQNNNRMGVYRCHRWCMRYHTPQLHLCLLSIGEEITRPLKEWR